MNQEESEQNEVDGMKKGADSTCKVIHREHCAISDHSAAICHQLSATLKSTRMGHFGSKVCGVPVAIDP